MTRKFAVTLFATSFTLIGCGSTSTTKQDAAPAAEAQAAEVATQNPDVVPTPDTVPVTPDTALVTPDTALVTPDTRPADVVTPQPEAGRDVAIVDAPNTDAGVDVANAGDGSDVDGGASDGGDGGQD
jgi:PBP1b-binding outer membrane lipoprotein LpoB